MLILRFLQLRSKLNWSLSNLVAIVRMNLFTHRDLWAWLNKPYEIPPVPYEQEQLKLNLFLLLIADSRIWETWFSECLNLVQKANEFEGYI